MEPSDDVFLHPIQYLLVLLLKSERHLPVIKLVQYFAEHTVPEVLHQSFEPKIVLVLTEHLANKREFLEFQQEHVDTVHFELDRA